MQHKKRPWPLWKKLSLSLLTAVLLLVLGFALYVANYYHAQAYEPKDTVTTESDDYIMNLILKGILPLSRETAPQEKPL